MSTMGPKELAQQAMRERNFERGAQRPAPSTRRAVADKLVKAVGAGPKKKVSKTPLRKR